MLIRCCDVTDDRRLVMHGGRDKVMRALNLHTDDVVEVNMHEDICELSFALGGRKIVARTDMFGSRRLAIFDVHWKNS